MTTAPFTNYQCKTPLPSPQAPPSKIISRDLPAELSLNIDLHAVDEHFAKPANLVRFDYFRSEDLNEFLNEPMKCDWEEAGISNFASL
jgi:hypothetical protein